MKIVHVVVVGPYTEGMTYQENILPICQAKQGHEVTVIANCTYWDKDEIRYTGAVEKYIDANIKLIRLPFVFVVHSYITEKLRWVRGLYEALKRERPDVLFLHDVATASTGQIKRYLKDYPHVAFVMDSHSTFFNSAHGWISRNILHGIIYKYFANKIYKYARLIYYIEPETKEFLHEVYAFPIEKMKFLSLGGVILSDEEYYFIRNEVRKQYAIGEDTIVFLHSGKLDANKKTIELLKAFIGRAQRKNTVLYIIGDTNDRERKQKIEELARMDKNIELLGWKSGKELSDFLCATDVYVQPGSPSVTLQLAACNRCGVVMRDDECYTAVFGHTEYMLSEKRSLYSIINTLCGKKEKVKELKMETYKKALEYLDYNRQAENIFNDIIANNIFRIEK